jgi:hypothetical protein
MFNIRCSQEGYRLIVSEMKTEDGQKLIIS